MSAAVIGATGRVGSEIVRGVLARGDAVTALVRDPLPRLARWLLGLGIAATLTANMAQG